MPESTHDGKELTPSEEIKNIYFTMRGRDADNAETMFAAILHYLDAQAEKPKEVMFTKEQVKAIHTQWNRDLRSWLEKHTEA